MMLYGKKWPNGFTKRFFIGMHMPDKDQNSTIPDMLKDADARQMVRQLADAGCDLVYCYMTCGMGNSYYPTRVKYGRIHSAFRDRDFFSELSNACVEARVALVAVYEFANQYLLKKPGVVPRDWMHYRICQADNPKRGHKKGDVVAAGMCWNGGYGDYALAQIIEVADAYPVAGFYIDMLDYPGRELCPACAERFRSEFGYDPPTGDTALDAPLFKDYKMWTFRETARYLDRVQQEVKKRIPHALVVSNYHAMIQQDFYEIRKRVDYVSTDPTIGYDTPYGLTGSTIIPAVFRALSAGKTADFDILYDPIVAGQLEIMPFEPYLSIAASAMAHGGWPVPSCMWQKDGGLHQGALGLARAVYTHIDRVGKWVGDWKSLKAAGLYCSQETDFLYANMGDPCNRRYSGHNADVAGAFMMLGAEHVLTDILTRRQLGRLSDYAVVCLPNVICLSKAEIEAFRAYVQNGGTLLANYKTSLANEWGQIQPNFQLADVMGVDFTGEKVEPYVALNMLLNDPRQYPFEPWETPCLTVPDSGVIVRPRPEARVLATLHDRYRPSPKPGELFKMSNAFMVESPLGPAIVENRFGQGRCLYISAKVFTAYAARQIPELRKLLTRWLTAREFAAAPVSVETLGCIKITAYERPAEGRWILHFLNHQSIPNDSSPVNIWREVPRIPMTDYIIPVHDVRVSLRTGSRRVRNVRMVAAGKEIPAAAFEKGYRFTIPVIHAHEVCVVEFDQPWPAETGKMPDDKDVRTMTHCPRTKTVEPAVTNAPRAHDGWSGDGAWIVTGNH